MYTIIMVRSIQRAEKKMRKKWERKKSIDLTLIKINDQMNEKLSN